MEKKTLEGVSSNNGGASGSFFFFSSNKNFLVKTMVPSEMKVLINMLPEMALHYSK